MKRLSIILFVGIVLGLMCSAYASDDDTNRVKSIQELIKEKKAQSVQSAEVREKDKEEMDEIIAQVFAQMLEEQAELQGEDGTKNTAETEGFSSFFHKIRHFFRTTKKKFRRFFRKVKRHFHRKRG